MEEAYIWMVKGKHWWTDGSYMIEKRKAGIGGIIIDYIVHAMSNANLQISRSYREANQVADLLAKLATGHHNGPMIFFSLNCPFQLDKW